MSVGKRIAEERKRRGLSQSAFAELVGVSFSSQRRYEDGRSDPDTAYIASLRGIDCDVDYILTGDTKSEKQTDNVVRSLHYVIQEIARRLGFREESVSGLFDSIHGNKDVFDCGSLPPIEVIDRMFDGCSVDIDGGLLTAILQGITTAEGARNARLSPEKAAGAAVMLYRAFKASGKVDPAMIEEAVKLAS